MECGVDAHGASPMKNREEEGRTGFITRMFRLVSTLLLKLHVNLKELCSKMLKLARDDPRRVYHSCKVGFALTIVSTLYFIWPINASMANNFIWAVMTVVVVLEYTVGGTLSKGLNRGFATLLAGALGVGVHYLGRLSGEKGEPIILGVFVFLLAAAATFSRFFPGIKARYDYGVLIFILTFSLVAVTGYREDELFKVAVERLGTVAIGGALCMLVSILICPVWAGSDLHKSIVNNLNKVADSLEACMEEYFDEGEGDGELKSGESSIQGCRAVLDSKTREESLANFARWEPPHGKFGIGHPWKQYLKVGAMTRKCAYCVEALDACIRSHSKAPKALRRHLKVPCLNVTSLISELLRELSTGIDTTTRSSTVESLIERINIGVDDLSTAFNLLPHANVHHHSTNGTAHASTYIMDVIPLATVTSILTETVGRIEGIFSAVDELSVLARFKDHVASYAGVGRKSTIKPQKNAAVNPLRGKEGPHVVVTVSHEAPLSGTGVQPLVAPSSRATQVK
ncbi:Aluminum-activated malate transporter 8 [Nymphaea thermarum]|nr:Aluminum-activated malate transporter 8 [Nymphaea thermarum]